MRSTDFKSKPKYVPVPFHSAISTLLPLTQHDLLNLDQRDGLIWRDNSPNTETERLFP